MSIFELKDKTGFSPPVQFQNTTEETTILSEGIKVKNILVLVSSEEYYFENKDRQKEDNVIRIYAKKNDKQLINKKVISLPQSGLTYNDLTIYGVTLSKNLVIKINEDKTAVKAIVDDTIKWLKIASHSERSNFRIVLTIMIQNHVRHFPKDFVYEPPKAYEEFYEMLQVCVKIGFLDISETAGLISKEVFSALANTIRKLKFGEERWNPNIGKDNDEKSKENSDKKYNPLLFDLTKIKETISNNLQDLEQKNNDNINSSLNSVEKIPNFNNITPHLQNVIEQAKNFIVRIILEGLEKIVNNLDHLVKLYNAYIVGFINGVIDFIAEIVEAIGFLFSLFNYESIKQLIEGVRKFINEVSWKEIRQLLKKELQKLFAFMIGDEAYKNAYEFGLFIPKMLEYAVDIIFIAKGSVNTARKLATTIKDIPDITKKVSKTFNDFANDVKLLKLNRKTIDELAEKGITVDVNYKINITANAGIPTKIIDGKDIKVYHDNVLLESFIDEAKANQYLERLKDPDFLNKEIAKKPKKLDDIAKSLDTKYREALEKRNFIIAKRSGKSTIDIIEIKNKKEVLRYRGADWEVENVMKVMSKSNKEVLRLFDNVIKGLMPRLVFNPFKDALKPLREAGVFIRKSARGLVPDFLSTPQFLYRGDPKFGKIEIKLTGVDDLDFKSANIKSDILKEIPKDRNTPEGYTWHHMDDYDPIKGTCTMQLVETKIHKLTATHTGGFGLLKRLFNVRRK